MSNERPFSSWRDAVSYAYAIHQGPGRARQADGPKGYRSIWDGVAVFGAMNAIGIDPWGPGGHALYEAATKKGRTPSKLARRLKAALVDYELIPAEQVQVSRRDLVNVTWTDPETGAAMRMAGNVRGDEE